MIPSGIREIIMKKKIVCLFMALILVFSCFAGCITIEDEEAAEETAAKKDSKETEKDDDSEEEAESFDDVIEGSWYEEEDGMITFTFDGAGGCVLDLYGECLEGKYNFDGENLEITDIDGWEDMKGYLNDYFNLCIEMDKGMEI